MKDDRETQEQRSRPKQTRGIETRNAILDAGSRIFAEQGYEQTTTHQIAAEAEVSVGALYRYFADKEAILKELYLREISDLRSMLLRGFSESGVLGQDIPTLVRRTMALTFEVYSRKPGLLRVLGEQSRKIPELAEMRRSQETLVHGAVRRILSSVPGVKLPDQEVGAYLVRLFIEALIEDHILYRRGEFADGRVVDAAAVFILRYFLGHLP